MTVYTVLPSGDRDPESPVTPELIDALYFNPVAIAEGDVTAPEIDGGAIANLTIPYSALTLSNSIVAGDIAANAVRMSELYTALGSHGTQIIQASVHYTLPENGYYYLKANSTAVLIEYLVNGSWVTMISPFDITLDYKLFWYVSGSMRIRNNDSFARTLSYQRVIG